MSMEMLTTDYINALLNKCDEALAKSRWASKIDTVALRQSMRIEFNDRYRTRGGACAYSYLRGTNKCWNIRIIFSIAFMKMTNEAEHFQLISHEYAHACHAFLSGSSDHGVVWQSIHIAMGGNGERCHSVAGVKKNKVKRHVLFDHRTGKLYQNVSTRTLNRCLRSDQIAGTKRFEYRGLKTA